MKASKKLGCGHAGQSSRRLDFRRPLQKAISPMVEAKTNDLMERLVALCKRRGFIFQSSEIYGGINGFWDYGPLGAELKRNIKEAWWQTMTRWRDDVVGLEATIIMHPKIWEASGHATTFADPMVDCLFTKKRFRADQIEPQSGTVYHYEGARDLAIWAKAISRYQEADRAKITEIVKTFKALKTMTDPESERLIAEGREIFEKEYHEFGISLDTLCEVYEVFETRGCHDAYSVLMPQGKHPEYARKIARQFYQQRGLDNPELLGERTEEVENSTRYNPENGSLLTEPRQFNLMFKTYVGPVESAENMAWLRPETAQAIFAQFKNVLEVSRAKNPLRHLPDRQGLPQRNQPPQFHLPLPRIRADGTGVLHPPRRGGRSHLRPASPSPPVRAIPARPSPIGAGKSGTSTGSRSASASTKISACPAPAWSNTGKNRRNWPITPAPPWTFFTNSPSANATPTAN